MRFELIRTKQRCLRPPCLPIPALEHIGAPGGTRTRDPSIKSRLLVPSELQAHIKRSVAYGEPLYLGRLGAGRLKRS